MPDSATRTAFDTAPLDAVVGTTARQGPEDAAEDCPTETKEAAGLGSIAEQTVDHGVDVLMGGGRARFEQDVTGGEFAGQTVLQQARRRATRSWATLPRLEGTTAEDKLLGLFSSGNMPTEFAPNLAEPYSANVSRRPVRPTPLGRPPCRTCPT